MKKDVFVIIDVLSVNFINFDWLTFIHLLVFPVAALTVLFAAAVPVFGDTERF